MGKKKPPVDKVEMEVNLRLYAKTEREREEKIAAAKAAGTYKETEKPPIDRETALNVKANSQPQSLSGAPIFYNIFSLTQTVAGNCQPYARIPGSGGGADRRTRGLLLHRRPSCHT